MANNIQYEIQQIKSLFPKLETSDLEDFMKEIGQIITKRRFPNKKNQELILLQKLNETGLSKEKLTRYLFLLDKRKTKELPANELKEYFRLIEEEQEKQLSRILILGELSKLKNISIKDLTQQLGIKPPASV